MAPLSPLMRWNGGMPDTPLRPDEQSTYATDVQTEDVKPEAPAASPVSDARPWIALGVVMLVVFIVAFVMAIGQALT